MQPSPACASLPSSDAVCRVVGGELAALPKVAGTMVLRAALLAGGMLLAGEREHVIRNAVAGSLAIEAFVIGWALFHQGGGT